jgi:putative membrane protein
MEILISLILSSVAVFVAANVLPGVHIDGFGTALILAVVLGIINAFIRPLLLLLTLPISILTLGLFSLFIIAFCVMLASWIVPGFHVDGWLWALVFAIGLALINAFIGALSGGR